MNFHPKLLNQNQITKCTQLANKNDRDGKRAKALLALHNGSTLKEASELSGLTHGQVRYILERFRKIGISSLAIEIVPGQVTITKTKTTLVDDKKEKSPKIRTKARSKKKKKKAKEEKPRKSKKRKQKDKEKRKEKVKMRIKKEKEKRKKDKKDKRKNKK